MEFIGVYAFCDCSSLKEVRFPSGLKRLGSGAFQYCNALTDVYSYTIEPIGMLEGTFSKTTVETATLHYPTTSKYNYYRNGGWGQFLNMEDFDEPYEYFYLNNDYTLNKGNGGVIDGTPDVDINEGGGLIVEDTNNETRHFFPADPPLLRGLLRRVGTQADAAPPTGQPRAESRIRGSSLPPPRLPLHPPPD